MTQKQENDMARLGAGHGCWSFSGAFMAQVPPVLLSLSPSASGSPSYKFQKNKGLTTVSSLLVLGIVTVTDSQNT